MQKLGRYILGLAMAVSILLAAGVCFHAAEVADRYTMYYTSYGKGAEFAGNSYIYLTGCSEDTRIVEAVCSNENIETGYDLTISAEGLGGVLELKGRDSVVSLTIKNKEKLRDNTKVSVDITVEEGGEQKKLTTWVLFKQVSFKNLYKGLVINGKKVRPLPQNVKKRQYMVRFRPKKFVKVKVLPKAGVRVKSIVYWYKNKKVSWTVDMKQKKNGRKVPLRAKKGRVRYFEIFSALKYKAPEGLTPVQQELFRYTQNAGLGMGLPSLGIHFK